MGQPIQFSEEPMDYYEKQFIHDLVNYCQFRSDAYWLRDQNLDHETLLVYSRQIRIGSVGWEPDKEIENDFYFCFYFTVLVDMAIHCHFPNEHTKFDQLTMYPKLFGMGVYQIMRPITLLRSCKFMRSEAPIIVNLWRSYCQYFIRDWKISIPQICKINIIDFFYALITDPDLICSLDKKEIRYCESGDSEKYSLEGKGYCYDSSDHLQSILIDMIKFELSAIDNQQLII
jgi:hypothetical protein